MDVFLSHSAADEKLAERLVSSLEKRGLSVWHDEKATAPGSDWRRETERAIRSAGNLVLLIDRHRTPDQAQQFTWQAALEAVWQDTDKVLIPVLRRGAELPRFALSGGAPQVVRLEDARNLRGVAEAIYEIARSRAAIRRRGETGAVRRVFEDDEEDTKEPGTRSHRGATRSASLAVPAEEALSAKSDREERLDYIEESASTADF